MYSVDLSSDLSSRVKSNHKTELAILNDFLKREQIPNVVFDVSSTKVSIRGEKEHAEAAMKTIGSLLEAYVFLINIA